MWLWKEAVGHLGGKLSLLDKFLTPGGQPFRFSFELCNPPITILFFLGRVFEPSLELGDRVLQYLGGRRAMDEMSSDDGEDVSDMAW